VLLLALATLLASPVRADASDDKEVARALYVRGNARFASGDYRGALEDFNGAHRLVRVPTTALGLGKTQMQLGSLIAARDSLRFAADFRPAAGEPASFTTARKEAARLVDALSERIPTLELRVKVEGRGSPRVSVDGEARTVGKAPLELDPGPHRVRIAVAGRPPIERALELRERERHLLEVVVPAPAAAAPGPSAAGAPALPTPSPRLRPGATTFQVSPLVWAGFSVATAGLLVGTVSGILSLESAAEVEGMCSSDQTCPPEAQDAIDRSLTTAHVSTAAFAVGGAGLVVGVTGLFLSGEEPASAGVRPELAPGWLGLRGRF
jgi:hypothetical protein